MITETIFENRFMHVPELMRMGAASTVHGAFGHRARRAAAVRRAGHGDRPARLGVAGPRRPRRRGRDRSSTASIISTAATSGWRRSSPPSAPTSTATRPDMKCLAPPPRRSARLFHGPARDPHRSAGHGGCRPADPRAAEGPHPDRARPGPRPRRVIPAPDYIDEDSRRLRFETNDPGLDVVRVRPLRRRRPSSPSARRRSASAAPTC